MSTPRLDADVLVVGGGPVGLAAAIEARLAGFSVTVLEPRDGVVDKACGEGLMPGAVAALERLGVRPQGRAFVGIRYCDASGSVEHRFRRGPGLGVRRTILHAALSSRAQEMGVGRLAVKADGVRQYADGVEAAGLRARWLLGCDGLHSTVRGAVGLTSPHAGRQVATSSRRFGLRRHYRTAPWSDLVEVHWGASVEAYVTPVAPDLVGVALLGPRGPAFDEALAGVPQLLHRLVGVEADGPVLGAGPLHQRTRARVAGRVLLVGDASGYVDALTGEGIRVGLAQARAAVRCLVEQHPQGYERAWRSATRDYRALTGGLLAAATRPGVRPLIVPAARRLPPVFALAVDRLAR